jgi:hypothetical protein
MSVPFGRGDKEDVYSNTLENIIEFKTNKYAPLVRSINKQLKEKNVKKKRLLVVFFAIYYFIIGSVIKQIDQQFTKMIGIATKIAVGLWCKKLVVKALTGSFMIWVKAKPET